MAFNHLYIIRFVDDLSHTFAHNISLEFCKFYFSLFLLAFALIYSDHEKMLLVAPPPSETIQLFYPETATITDFKARITSRDSGDCVPLQEYIAYTVLRITTECAIKHSLTATGPIAQ